MRRRKPTRTALKIVSGNPGRSALPKDEPALVAGAKAPAWPAPLRPLPSVESPDGREQEPVCRLGEEAPC